MNHSASRPSIEAAALEYLERGWSFYPTRPRSKEPFLELCPRWKPYQSALPERRDALTWFRCCPGANLALITGAVSGLVILDCDDEDSTSALLELCGVSHLRDFETPVVRSRQGLHFYFSHPGHDVRGDLGLAACDVKGDGGCCTAPPSLHATGHLYRFLVSPDQCDLAPLPTPILARLDARRKKREIPAESRQLFRHSGSATPYARKALQNATAEITAATEKRHVKLYNVALSIGRLVAGGQLDEPTARGALLAAARSVGLPQSEAARTLRDAFGQARARPRVAEERPSHQRPFHNPVYSKTASRKVFA